MFKNTDEVKNLLHFLTKFYRLLPTDACNMAILSSSFWGSSVGIVGWCSRHGCPKHSAARTRYCVSGLLHVISVTIYSLCYFLAVFKFIYM